MKLARVQTILFHSILIILFLSATASFAEVYFWQGGENQIKNWHDASNWDSNTVPTSVDYAKFKSGGTAEISTADAVAARVYIAQKDKGGNLILSDRTLTIYDQFNMGLYAVAGTYDQYGASSVLNMQNKPIYIGSAAGADNTFTLHDGTITNCGQLQVGASGTGRFYQQGGTVSMTDILFLGAENGSLGEFHISGGTFDALTSDQKLRIGDYGQGIMTLSGGTVQAKSIYVAYRASSTGSVSITGGTLTTTKDLILPYDASANGAALTIQGNQATINVGGSLNCTNAPCHIHFILDGNPGGISTINCNNAKINSSNVTIEWSLGDDFRGTAGSEYMLIVATNAIDISNCNFVDSTAGGNFNISLSADEKTLFLKQTENYPENSFIFLLM